MKTETKITVRYAETDQMGIVHHSNYAVWYEAARTDFIKKMGMSYSKLEQLGIIMPLVSLECNYHGPAFYEDELTVTAELVKATGVKVEFAYAVYSDRQEKPINTGKTVLGIVDRDRKPFHLKKKFPDIYQMFQDAVEK